MNNIEILKTYVDILERGGKNPTQSDYDAIYYLRKHPELFSVLKDINNAYTKEDKLRVINNYAEELGENIETSVIEEEEEIYFPEDALTYSNDFKEVVKNNMEKYNIKDSLELIYSNIQRYSKNMSLLDEEIDLDLITREYYAFYKEMCDEYISSQNIDKVHAKRLLLNEAGYIIAIVASIISIIISIITIFMIIK